MGHMKHSTKAVLIAEDKREFEQFGLSEGVRRLKANCIRGIWKICSGRAYWRRVGTTGKGTYYVLNRKRLTKGSKGSS
jgi:hypothetical protein